MTTDFSRSRKKRRPDWIVQRIANLNRRLHRNIDRKPRESVQDRAARRSATAAVVIAFFTFVTVAVSALQYLVLDGQFKVMQGQLDEMKSTGKQTDKLIEANKQLADAATIQAAATTDAAKTSRSALAGSQRAWVAPRNAKLAAEPKAGEPIQIDIEYQNVGREPATNFIYEVTTVFPAMEQIVEAFRRTSEFMTSCMSGSPKGESGGQVIYPTLGFNQYEFLVNVDKSHIDDAVVSGRKVILLHGCFTYQTLRTTHHSFFCYFYRAGLTKIGALNICPTGHNAD